MSTEVDSSKPKITPMPYSIRLTVLFVIVSEHMILFMIPTFVAFMMDGFYRGTVPDTELNKVIATNSGLLEGMNGMMGFFGCLVWGSVSDKIGRKFGLIIVLSGMIIASIGFGLAPSYEFALGCRILAGLMAGVVPITKALLQDVSDDTNIAILYSYLGAGYGFGSILGPIVGGTLAHPERLLPGVFAGTIFESNPYFLPQLVHSCFALTSLVMVILFIKPKPQVKKEDEKPTNIRGLFTNKNYMISLLIFVLIAVVQFAYRIIMALWVKLGYNEGGLGWTAERDVGYMNATSGIIVTLYHLFIVPLLKQHFGVIKSCVFLTFQLVPVILFISWTNELPLVLTWIFLIICNGFSIVSTTAGISFISIALANSVDSNILGVAMGISQSVIAFIRGFSIASFGWLFGVSSRWSWYFPFNTHFCFMIIVLVLILTWIVTETCLDKSVEKRKVSKETELPLLQKKET